MREDELKKELKEFPQHQKLDEDMKAEMKRALRKEVGKEPKPFTERRLKPWIAGLAGIAAFIILVVTTVAITGTGGDPTNDLNPAKGSQVQPSQKEVFQQELDSNEDVVSYSWSPDQQKVLFVEEQNEGIVVKLRNINQNETESLIQTSALNNGFSWSPTSEYAIYMGVGTDHHRSYVININQMNVINNDTIFLTGSPQWGPKGKKVVFGQTHPNHENLKPSVTMFNFLKESYQKLYEADLESTHFFVGVWNQNEMTIETRFLEEDQKDYLYLSKKGDKWFNLDGGSPDAEPGTKQFIEQTLYSKINVQIENVTWSPDESIVAYTESPINAPSQDVYLWRVGEGKPKLIKNNYEGDVHTLEGFKWSSNNDYFIELYSYGGANQFLWTVVDTEKGIRSESFSASKKPTWGPSGNQITWVEAIREETDTGTKRYQALKIYNLIPNMKGSIETVYKTNDDWHEIEVENWHHNSTLEMVYRNRFGQQHQTTFVFRKVDSEWTMEPKNQIKLRAFGTPVHEKRILKEEPYSLWNEVDVSKPLLGEDHNVTVHLYSPGNDANLNYVFLKYGDRWFFVQGIKMKGMDITTQQVTTDDPEEIVIQGTTVTEEEEIPIMNIIRFNSSDDSGNNFNLVASIPNIEEIDVNGDGEKEILSNGESNIYMYPTNLYRNRLDKINLKTAVGMEGDEYIVEIISDEKGVIQDGGYLLEVKNRETGEIVRFEFHKWELHKLLLED